MERKANLVSIGIPTYNSAEYIVETLDSIAAQTYRPIELIIVDDGSSDNTVAVVNEWILDKKDWVKFDQNPQNLGLLPTCNRLFSLSSGEYFQLLGSDDVLFPNKIDDQVSFFQSAKEELALVYSDVQIIDEEGKLLQKSYFEEQGRHSTNMPQGHITGQLLNENFIPSPSVLIKSNILERFMPYDESLGFEDYDMWLRISLHHKIACIPAVLASYRRRKNSLMHDRKSRYNLMNSTLKCLNKYKGIKVEWDKIIASKIYDLTPALYRFGHPESRFWVKQMWDAKKNYKSLMYNVLSMINYKFNKA